MIQIFIALTIFYLMFEVGSNLSVKNFSFALQNARLILSATLLQVSLVPFAALGILWTADLDPVIGMGLLLIAAAPIGAMSNYYVNVARGDLALAVLLTGATSLLSFITAPIICLFVAHLLALETIAGIPFAQIMRQTIPNVLVPVVAGMLARHWMRDWLERYQRHRERLCCALLVTLLGVVLVSQVNMITASMVLSAAWISVVFTVLLLCIGWSFARLMVWDQDVQRSIGLLFGFPARNIGLSTLLAANVFGKIELATFGAIFFAMQLLMLMPTALWLKRSYAAASYQSVNPPGRH